MRVGIRKRLLQILSVPIILALALPISALLNNNPAFAATLDTPTATSDKRNQLWYDYYAVIQCFSNASGYNFGESDIKSGQFYGGTSSGSVKGIYERDTLSGVGADGSIDCRENNSQVIKQALTDWGINGIDLVCGANIMQRTDGTSCTSGTNGFQWLGGSGHPTAQTVASLESYLQKQFYGGSAPTMTDADQYQYNLVSFENGCARDQKFSNTNPGGARVYSVKTFPSSSLGGTTQYIVGTQDSSASVAFSPKGTDKTCGDMVKDINKYAQAYGTQESCRNLYTDATLVAACIDGGSHTGSGLSYCGTNYADIPSNAPSANAGRDNTDSREACYAGQGNAGAEQCSANPAYKSDTSLWQACIHGAQNYTNSGYCTATYTPGPNYDALIAACNAGQKLGSGVQTLDPSSVADASGNGTSLNGDQTCGDIVSVIGWIVCPVLNAIGGLDDTMWNLVVGPLLNVSPLTQTNKDGSASPAFTTWDAFRNLADVVLVIVFLIIIFSQLTGAGVSNYGVKKMLPRLVIAAILINVSYFVMEVAVDLANIIGNSLYQFIAHLVDKPVPSWSGLVGLILSGGIALGVGIGALLSTGAEAFLLFLIPLALAALLGFFAAIFTLILRQAAIPILAITAPLAFAAYILPNTQKWFDRWLKLLTSMLMLYPLASLLFGGVQVASAIILGEGGALSMLIGLLILGVPLFALPFIARQTGPMLGKLNGTMRGWANRGSKAASGATEPYRNRAMNNALARTPRSGVLGAPLRVVQTFRRGNQKIKAQAEAAKRQLAANEASTLAKEAPGWAEGAEGSAAQSYLRGLGARAEAEELKEAMIPLDAEVATEAAQGHDTDTFLKARATDMARTQAERNAAVHRLAHDGRDKALRELKGQQGVEGAAYNAAISANASALANKAPDLLKGDKAFEDVTADELLNFSGDTMAAHLDYLDRMHKDPAQAAAYVRSVQSLNNALVTISGNTTLAARYKSGNIGSPLRNGVVSYPTLAGDLSGALSHIAANGDLIPSTGRRS